MRRLIRLAWVPTFAAAIQLSAQTSGPVNPDYAATIAVLPGVEFAKQGDGRWLITLDDGSAIAEPDDAKVKAAIEKHIATVLADIEAGRVRSPGEIPSLFFSLFGG